MNAETEQPVNMFWELPSFQDWSPRRGGGCGGCQVCGTGGYGESQPQAEAPQELAPPERACWVLPTGPAVPLVASVQESSSLGHPEGGTSGAPGQPPAGQARREATLPTGSLSSLSTQCCVTLPSCPCLSLAQCPGQPSRHAGPLLPTHPSGGWVGAILPSLPGPSSGVWGPTRPYALSPGAGEAQAAGRVGGTRGALP